MNLDLRLDDVVLPGDLTVPQSVQGLVVFAHGSGSSRHSPRNRQVANRLVDAGFATLLFDLLTEAEGRDRGKVFNIALLGERLAAVVEAVARRDDVGGLPIGLFGASTGAAAALDAAASLDAGGRSSAVAAVVSRGGRPDLASDLTAVSQPVLLIVGGGDAQVLQLNRAAADRLADAAVEVVSGAGHLFEGPGELAQVASLAAQWFSRHLAGRAAGPASTP